MALNRGCAVAVDHPACHTGIRMNEAGDHILEVEDDMEKTNRIPNALQLII